MRKWHQAQVTGRLVFQDRLPDGFQGMGYIEEKLITAAKGAGVVAPADWLGPG